MKSKNFLLAVLLLSTLNPQPSTLSAATRTWDGSANGLLSNGANWVGGVAPVNGDNLVFPASGVSRFVVTNNFIGGPRFPTITFTGSGYQLWGAFIVTSRLEAQNLTGVNRVWCPLQVDTNGGVFSFNGGAGATFEINGNVDLGPSGAVVSAQGGMLRLRGVLSGTGGLTKGLNGTVRLEGSDANTYTGHTVVFLGTLELAKGGTFFPQVAVPGRLTLNDSTIVRLLYAGQISSNSFVTIGAGALLDLQSFSTSIGSLAGEGQVIVGANSLGVGVNGASTTYSGQITGTGGLTKMGLGTLTLTGTNTYSGTTLVADGTLVVNGVQSQSPVDVTNGTLGGTGTVGNITVSGSLMPGASAGRLTCSNLTFSAQGDFFVELGGAFPGVNGYDQMNVRGTVALNGATLHVANHSAPFEGQSFVIIANDGADPVAGTFAGLPNGSVLSLSGVQFHLRYNSPGNNVELIATNTALRIFGSPVVSSGNLNARIDPNECNLLHVVLSNAASVPVTGIRATLRPQSDGASAMQPFATYPDLAPGELGTNQTPFQVSLLPGLVCGAGLASELLIETTSHGTFRDAAGSPTGGVPGTPVRFDNNGLVAIPDLNSVNSIINVSGIEGLGREVTVSLHIVHPAVEDLDISLIGPGGETVDLSSDNGGAAANYGTGCADDQRTLFDDDPIPLLPRITASSAPFVGTFRPEQFLATFDFDSGPRINGPWTLRVSDDTSGDTGILHCWSLFITPFVCSPTGGPCESCPERTILGALGDSSQLQTGRLVRNGAASACGVAKSCPGVEDAATPRRFDAYTFVNGETNACITVTLGVSTSVNCDLFSAAYTNAFNPLGLCQNYLADLGNSVSSGGTNSYSFNVAARQRFVVVVSQSDPSSAYCPYRLDATGGSCHPVLRITDAGANRAALDWTTAAIGYQLERTNALAAPSLPQWLPITNPPSILNSRFRLTNTVAPDPTRFYRLRKP